MLYDKNDRNRSVCVVECAVPKEKVGTILNREDANIAIPVLDTPRCTQHVVRLQPQHTPPPARGYASIQQAPLPLVKPVPLDILMHQTVMARPTTIPAAHDTESFRPRVRPRPTVRPSSSPSPIRSDVHALSLSRVLCSCLSRCSSLSLWFSLSLYLPPHFALYLLL